MSTRKIPALRVNFKACTGCRTCTIVCALNHEHRLEFARSRIRVEKSLPRITLPIFRIIARLMCMSSISWPRWASSRLSLSMSEMLSSRFGGGSFRYTFLVIGL